MGVARVARSHTRDRERKGKGKVGGVTVGSEADFAARKSVHELKHRISARLPSPPDAQRSLANIDVTRTIATVTVAPMDARSTDEAIQAGSDCFHRIHRFDEYPNLDHVAGFPIVRRGFKTRGDYHPVGVFMENESVQREPPSVMGTIDRSNLVGTGFPSQYLACALYL